MKIAFVGGPSTGKTTLGLQTTAELKRRGVTANFVGEYARTWMAKHNRHPRAVEDQALIMRGQRKREAEAALTQDVVVTDSTTWMCAMYATLFVRPNGPVDPSANVSLNDLFEDVAADMDSYDLTFFVPRCFGIKTEPGRVQTTIAEARRMDDKILGFGHVYDIPLVVLPPKPRQWLELVMSLITNAMELEAMCG